MTPHRLYLAFLLALAAVGVGAGAAIRERAAVPDSPPPAYAPEVREAPPVVSISRPRGEERVVAPKTRKRRPRLPRGNDVRAALRRALLIGAIDRRHWRAYRATDRRARRALRKLSGARRGELLAVVRTIDGLAASGRLTASRQPLAFLTLRRNVDVWAKRSFPSPAERMTFSDDPAVFQYYAGRGVQYHPLASAGRINALVQPCLRSLAAKRCRPGKLRTALDRLLSLSTRRGDFRAWEYLFSYGGGSPPWVSGMAQATAAQALARGWKAFGLARYRTAAVESLGAFRAPPPLGVASGRHYLMYSFNPGLRIQNGFLQAVIGLHDVAKLTGSKSAWKLFRAGEREARATLAAYDTGAWSLYSRSGRESPLGYHRLVTGFLAGLCTRKAGPGYCDRQARYSRYLREPPRVSVSAPSRLRRGRVGVARFSLSKVSSVVVRVRDRVGTVMARRMSLPRGAHTIGFRPRLSGTTTISVHAVGPEGRRAVKRTSLTVTKPPPPPKRRKARKSPGKGDGRGGGRGPARSRG